MRQGNRRRRAGMWIAGLAVITSFGVTACCARQQTKGTKVYHGAWFAIAYPNQFKVRNGLPGRTTGGRDRRYDSAFFVSPDKKIEFYVFSPQWNGEPTDYAVDPRRERVVKKKESSVIRDTDGVKHTIRERLVTVRAKDGSYVRSWVDDWNDKNNGRAVFGIKYANRRTYLRYKRQFEIFKKSLEQFAD